MSVKYPKVENQMLTGDEIIRAGGQSVGLTLFDFWKWQGSRLLDNALRGVLAEFFVTKALGCKVLPRMEWDNFDCLTVEGIKVEVKSSAYLQSWDQKELATITFGIQPTQGWDAASNIQTDEIMRHADVYVFCVLAHQDQETLDPLNLDQWDFYAISTKCLDRKIPGQKRITLSSLLKIFSPERVSYTTLRKAVLTASKE